MATRKFIAFLRAINVGGHIVKMDRLRQLFEALKLGNVETFIASGNVIFDSPAKDVRTLELQIESHLKGSLGYAVTTFLRTPAEVAHAAAFQPFPEAPEDSTLYVGFLAAAPSPEVQAKVAGCRTPVDEFHVHEREVYWLCHKRFSESPFSGAKLERALGMPTTLRNLTTVRKLAAKTGG
ncbi:MAG TPA: DUF1697 domain-containing protein [Thermoanaerobaculia bacterium]|jgi:uncharacterized protein (DUF1697 family)|nr:DUF1697 domain-containing protein [Thermoanaerobaculia bacterium]